jgi:hypothetical protein
MTSLSLKYRLSQNAWGHWILVSADDPSLAWTGSGWTRVTGNGFPADDTQVSNFRTREEAVENAKSCGLIVREELERWA